MSLVATWTVEDETGRLVCLGRRRLDRAADPYDAALRVAQALEQALLDCRDLAAAPRGAGQPRACA